MKKHKIIRVLLGLVIAVVGLLLVTVVIMYRADLSREELEAEYFTEESHYLTAAIDDLDGNPVSISVHYTDAGAIGDPVVVLLHGMFSSSHTFDAWTETLLESGYRVIAIDLPNHGLTGNFSDNTGSTRRSAAVVKYLLDELDVTACTIGGNSMGGGVAWHFASAYHDVDGFSVEGLVLIDAVYPDMTDGGPAGLTVLLSHPWLGRFLSKMTPRFLLKRILSDVYGSTSTLSESTVDRYYDLLRKEGNREALILTVRESAEDDGLERLDVILAAEIPVLVLWGAEDRWISADYASLFQSALGLSDEDVIVYAGLGHVPMEEDPESTAIDLIRFLDAHRG